MAKLKRFWVVAVLLIVALAACGAASMDSRDMSQEAVFDAETSPSVAQSNDTFGDMAEMDADDGIFTGDSPQQPAERERVILQDASMSIVVEDTLMTIDTVSTMADEMGGWVVNANSNTNQYSDDREVTNGNISVRVPAERLNETLTTIRELALEVESESVNGRDVTAEYVDLSSRLRNLQATEEQLVSIMEEAYTVEDVLAVQTELTTIREQIEVIEGRLRFFDEAAAYSSVSLTVRERLPQIGEVQVAGWNPLNTAANALGALIVTGQFVVDTAITLVILGVPALLILGAVVWLLRRIWRLVRGRPNRQTPVTAPASE